MCDAVNGKPAKALVKLSTEGVHDASWVTKAATDSYGHEVVDHDGKLYLAAEAATFWPSWIREPAAIAVGCATPQVRCRR